MVIRKVIKHANAKRDVRRDSRERSKKRDRKNSRRRESIKRIGRYEGKDRETNKGKPMETQGRDKRDNKKGGKVICQEQGLSQ